MPADPQSALPVELVEVVKDFGSQRVLDGVDLVVRPGAITVLLGPSGAGKTVTIKHIVGLLQPDGGAVRVEGKDLAAISEEELYEVRRGMSVVLQGTLPFSCGLFYSLNVYDNVAYALRERTRWAPERIDRVTTDYLRLVGMQEHAQQMPADLSGGESKRTALARALALESRIVLIDDFDSGIDSVRLTLLGNLIREAQRDTDAAFLITTHDMRAARELADYAAVINAGRIVASGEADAVFSSDDPLVRQLVGGERAGPIELGSA